MGGRLSASIDPEWDGWVEDVFVFVILFCYIRISFEACSPLGFLTCVSFTFVAQEYVADSSRTSRNSLSLQRAPGPSYGDVRGSAANYPFWPGRASFFSILTLFTYRGLYSKAPGKQSHR